MASQEPKQHYVVIAAGGFTWTPRKETTDRER